MKLYIVEVHFWADMVFMLQDNVVLAFVLIVWHNCSCLLCNTVFTNYALHSGDFVGFLWQWSMLFSSFFFFFQTPAAFIYNSFLWLYVCTNVSQDTTVADKTVAIKLRLQ